MNILKSLLSRKTELEAQISERRALAMNCEQALSLCDGLEAKLPALIVRIQEERTEPRSSPYSAPDDYVGKTDLVAQSRAVKAAERLLKELPAIRKHWKAVQETLFN